MDRVEETKKLLKKYNQNHIIKLLDELDEEKKESLIEQINNIDFHQMSELYANTKISIKCPE